MKPIKHINLQALFNSTTLNTRDEADLLFQQLLISTAQEYILDFSSIQFISRSFADQFIKQLNHFEYKSRVKLLNSNLQIVNILASVRKTQKPKKIEHLITRQVYSFESIPMVYQYLQDI
jgi:hypothetical protein